MNLAMVVFGALLGFGASQWFQMREESLRKQVVVYLICDSIRNDLGYTIGVTGGLRDSILKKKIGADPTMFRLLYHPTVVIPDSNDVGLLKSHVIMALDEYRRMLSECELRRQEHIRALEDPSQKNMEVTLLTYVIGLDALIARGANLLHLIETDYPETKGNDNQIAAYTPIQGYIGDIQKAINEETAERLQKEKPNKSLEPTPVGAGSSASRTTP